MNIKTEKLKKLETELKDLQQWLKLSLVPKQDLAKHKEEIKNIQDKIEEEKERIQSLRESGDLEELYTTRKVSSRIAYQDSPTMSDLTMDGGDMKNTMMDSETDIIEAYNTLSSYDSNAEGKDEETDWEDPFSDRARWSRGILDPDDDSW